MKRPIIAALIALSTYSSICLADFSDQPGSSWSNHISIPGYEISDFYSPNTDITLTQTSTKSFTVASNSNITSYLYWDDIKITLNLIENDRSNCTLHLKLWPGEPNSLEITDSSCPDLNEGGILETKNTYGFSLSNEYIDGDWLVLP